MNVTLCITLGFILELLNHLPSIACNVDLVTYNKTKEN